MIIGLTYLSVYGCVGVTDEGVRMLAPLTGLTTGQYNATILVGL
jgi:hypothetical protein